MYNTTCSYACMLLILHLLFLATSRFYPSLNPCEALPGSLAPLGTMGVVVDIALIPLWKVFWPSSYTWARIEDRKERKCLLAVMTSSLFNRTSSRSCNMSTSVHHTHYNNTTDAPGVSYLVPRPSHCTGLDHLEYAKLGNEAKSFLPIPSYSA